MMHVEPRGERVAVLRMDDGKVNAMSPRFLDAFDEAWAGLAREKRAIVLAGNQRAFCAGLDLKALPAMPPAELLGFVRRFVRFFAVIATHPQPVVAAVDGPALAGGAILALASDLRVVTPRARLGLTELPVGVPFPDPVLDLVRHALPPQELGPAVFQGAVREGEACVAKGWAHHLGTSESAVDDAVAMASELASFSPLAYAAAKRGLRGPLLQRAEHFEKHEAEAYVQMLSDPRTMAAITGYFRRMAAQKGHGTGAAGSGPKH